MFDFPQGLHPGVLKWWKLCKVYGLGKEKLEAGRQQELRSFHNRLGIQRDVDQNEDSSKTLVWYHKENEQDLVTEDKETSLNCIHFYLLQIKGVGDNRETEDHL